MIIKFYDRLNAEQGYFGQKIWKQEFFLPLFWESFCKRYNIVTAEDFLVGSYSLPSAFQEFLGWDHLEEVEQAIRNLKSDLAETNIAKELKYKYPWWRQI